MPRKQLALALLAVSAFGSAETGKPRIYLTESGATEVSAENLQITRNTSAESVEVMKAFTKYCPAVIITGNREKANYIVRFDREGTSPITPFTKGNKVAVFNKEDDLIFSDSSRFLPAAVKSACAAIASNTKR